MAVQQYCWQSCVLRNSVLFIFINKLITMLLYQLMSSSLIQKDDSSQIFQPEQAECQASLFGKITSEFKEEYLRLLGSRRIEIAKLQESFMRNDIAYEKYSPYEKFHFNAQRIVPCFDFYRLHIKFGHFRLIANIAKYPSFSVPSTPKGIIQGNNIHFTAIKEKALCFKVFQFHEEHEFRKVLLRAVKQWSILKICSVLQVGPYVQNYLGFDIIVSQRLIEFAMQKGVQMTYLKEDRIKQLQQQLRLMHQFKIIHCDIKPQNIIFSEHFNKPVFIDFGFSQIIREEIGEKTKTSFKGTPNFCSPEMFSIIIQGKDFIDMYYNDAFSLKQTCRYYQLQSFKEDSDQYKVEQIYYPFQQQQPKQSEFIFCALQFYYLTHSYPRVKSLLEEYLAIDKRNIKKVLLFIKKAVNYIFMPNIFYGELKPFCNLAEYREIEEKMKLASEVFYFNRNPQDQQNIGDQSMTYFSQQCNSFGLQRHQYQNYLKIILNAQRIESLQEWIAMTYQCIRFDLSNLQFDDKVKIANKMNPLLAQILQKNEYDQIQHQLKANESEGLKSVRILMRLIFHLCVCRKASRWAIEYIFDVFQQLIILNDYFSLARPFLSFIENNQIYLQGAVIQLQLRRLLESTSMLKFQREKHQIFTKIIGQHIQKYRKQYMVKSSNSQKPESILIIDTFNFLQKDVQHLSEGFLTCYEKLLNSIKNPKIRNYLFFFTAIKIIKIYLQIGNSQQILKVIETIKKSINMYNLDFLNRANITINLMYLTYNEAAIQIYYNYIASVVNCPQVLRNIQTERYLERYDKFNCSKIDRLIQKMPFLGAQIYFEMFLVLWNETEQQIKKNPQFYAKFIQIYNVYTKIRTNYCTSQQNAVQKYLDLFKRIKIQIYFYEFSNETKQAFLLTLDEFSRQLKLIEERSQQICEQYINFTKCKVFICRYYLCLSHQQQKDCLFYLQQIINICQKNNIVYLMIEVLKSLNYNSSRWNNKEIVIYSTEMLFNYCKAKKQMIFYLTQAWNTQLLQALYTFARFNRPLFYQILLESTGFLSDNFFHASRSYFFSFLVTIDEFLKKDSCNSHLIHYSKFYQYDLKANPYLLIFCAYSLFNEQKGSQQRLLRLFAIHAVYLSSFARVKLLEKYYITLVSLIIQKSKRRIVHVFREAKKYIGQKLRKKLIKIFKGKRQSIYYKLFKKKLKSILRVF